MATTNQLMEEAKCIDQCIPRGMQLSVLIALLAKVGGVSTDPNTLMAMARCIDCAMPTGLQMAAVIALANRLTTGDVPTPCVNQLPLGITYGPVIPTVNVSSFLTPGLTYIITFGVNELQFINGSTGINNPGAGESIEIVAEATTAFWGLNTNIAVTAVVCEIPPPEPP